MRKTGFFLQIFIIVILSSSVFAGNSAFNSLSGQNLHITGDELITSENASGEILAYFKNNVSVSIGNSNYEASGVFAKIISNRTEYLGQTYLTYNVQMFLEGNVVGPDVKHVANVDIYKRSAYQDTAIAMVFVVTGQIYATADIQRDGNVEDFAIYQKASTILGGMTKHKLLTTVQKGAGVPKIERIISPDRVVLEESEKKEEAKVLISNVSDSMPTPQRKQPRFKYPVNISSATSVPVQFDSQKLQTDDGLTAVVVTGRFYLWQQIEQGLGVIELVADNAVIYYAGDQVKFGKDTGDENLAATGPIHSVFLSGNVEMSEGSRTIRAEKMYYDFNLNQGLAIEATIKSFDEKENVPIYIHADRMRQIAQNQFTAEDVVVTTSEFADHQVKLTASNIILTDTTPIDQINDNQTDSSYSLEMNEIAMFYGDMPFFYWPKMKTNLERPDTALKTVHVSDDSDFGFSVETRWHLFRMLGLEEPDGVDSIFAFDIYGERGLGSGVETNYKGEKYNGRILAYIISDNGEDDLGRTRKNIEPEEDIRGRFRIQHRHYLEDDWQFTFETSYISDRNFVEAFYRNEFNTGKEQETVAHLKRTWDNQSISVLGKIRINDFVDKLEELPTVQYHLTGQSLFDDRFTFFSDSQVSRYRHRYDNDSASASDPTMSEKYFTFAFSRAELDMPLNINRTKVVPYVAGMVGYDDLYGFNTDLGPVASTNEKEIFVGEAGLRISKTLWKVDPDVKCDFWNINGIRHIVKPHAEFAFFTESDDQAEQRDMINVGLAQRWQTKRLFDGQYQSVDWMRLSVDATFVNEDEKDSTGPDRFVWNNSFQPLLFRKDDDAYGIRRDKINADYYWQVSDSTAVLSDLNYDMESGTVGQFDIGLSHFRSPDLSYYIGSRYLNNVTVLDEKGSHALLYALTYKINPKYTVLFSQEYNFDYGHTLESEMTLIRKYHRVYWAITVNTDSSLDRSGILFSIWPEGVKDLTLGSRKFFGLAGSDSTY